MNRLFRICFLCLAGVVLFVFGMVTSFYFLVIKEKNLDQTLYPKQSFLEDVSEYEENVAVNAEPSVDKSTEYIIIKENRITGETQEITEELPARFVGLSREELENYFEEYELSPSLNDRQEGFTDAFVESYSPQRLVVCKVYEPLHEIECYYLKAEENYVVIYYADESTVYMYTGIRMDMLPEDIRKEIENGGKEIQSEEKLYSFLESYTS